MFAYADSIVGIICTAPLATLQTLRKVCSERYFLHFVLVPDTDIVASPGPHKGRESLPLILFLRYHFPRFLELQS